MSDSSTDIITSFTATLAANQSTSIDAFSTSGQTVNLAWTLANGASGAVLDGYGAYGPDSTGCSVTIHQTTTFILTAFAPTLNLAQTLSQTVTITPDPVSQRVPTGTILPWTGAVQTIPPGWLLCDGTAYSTTTYAALYSVIGTAYGANPPAGTFMVPDLSGRFVQGAGGSSSDAPQSSSEGDFHTHPTAQGQTITGSGTTSEGGSHTHGMPSIWSMVKVCSGDRTTFDCGGIPPSEIQTQGNSANHTHTVSLNTIINSFTTDASTSVLLPPLFALYYVIKA